ncbi:hypothetical protein HDU98_011075 [Podochytrium sp. JEL0797]|nr:hypothetical protein HDU98_011075 [Podochytrium sp. JEL0797]
MLRDKTNRASSSSSSSSSEKGPKPNALNASKKVQPASPKPQPAPSSSVPSARRTAFEVFRDDDQNNDFAAPRRPTVVYSKKRLAVPALLPRQTNKQIVQPSTFVASTQLVRNKRKKLGLRPTLSPIHEQNEFEDEPSSEGLMIDELEDEGMEDRSLFQSSGEASQARDKSLTLQDDSLLAKHSPILAHTGAIPLSRQDQPSTPPGPYHTTAPTLKRDRQSSNSSDSRQPHSPSPKRVHLAPSPFPTVTEQDLVERRLSFFPIAQPVLRQDRLDKGDELILPPLRDLSQLVVGEKSQARRLDVAQQAQVVDREVGTEDRGAMNVESGGVTGDGASLVMEKDNLASHDKDFVALAEEGEEEEEVREGDTNREGGRGQVQVLARDQLKVVASRVQAESERDVLEYSEGGQDAEGDENASVGGVSDPVGLKEWIREQQSAFDELADRIQASAVVGESGGGDKGGLKGRVRRGCGVDGRGNEGTGLKFVRFESSESSGSEENGGVGLGTQEQVQEMNESGGESDQEIGFRFDMKRDAPARLVMPNGKAVKKGVFPSELGHTVLVLDRRGLKMWEHEKPLAKTGVDGWMSF